MYIAPGVFKRRALSYLPTQDGANTDPGDKPAVVLPQQQNISLRVSLTMADSSGKRTTSHSRRRPVPDTHDANAMLAEAQRRVVEQEIFSLLIRDAAALSYASSRVSERLIELEAAQDVVLRFELLEDISSRWYSAKGRSTMHVERCCLRSSAMKCRRHL